MLFDKMMSLYVSNSASAKNNTKFDEATCLAAHIISHVAKVSE